MKRFKSLPRLCALVLLLVSVFVVAAPLTGALAMTADEFARMGMEETKRLAEINRVRPIEYNPAPDVDPEFYSPEYVSELMYSMGCWNRDLPKADSALSIIEEYYTRRYNFPGIYKDVVRELKNNGSLRSYSARSAFSAAVANGMRNIPTRPGYHWEPSGPSITNYGLINTSTSPIYKDGEGNNYHTDISASNQSSGKVGKIEELFAGLVRDLTARMETLLNNAGMNIDTAIFGRVNGYGIKMGSSVVAPFTFELETGNVFGTVAAAIYGAVRTYAYLFMAFAVLLQLARLTFVRGRQGFEALGGVLRNAAFSMFLIVMMPYLMEVVLYLRDIVLYNVVLGTMGKLGLGTAGIVSAFRSEALASKSLMDALLYLVAVCMQLVYVCIYVGLALEMMIQFITFPVICIKGCADLSAFQKWTGRIMSLVLIPIADATLFILPCVFLKFGNEASGQAKFTYSCIALVTLGLMSAVRKTFFEALGLQAGGVADAAVALGAAGAAVLGGTAKKLTSAGKETAKSAGEAISQSRSQKADSETYEKMADEVKKSGGAEPLPAPNNGEGGGEFGQSQRLFKSYGSTDQFADAKNFQNREIWDGLSFEKKAELTKEASRKGMYKGLGRAVGHAAGGFGGALGGGLIGGAMGLGFGGIHGLAAGGVAGAEIGNDVVGGAGGLAGSAAGVGLAAAAPHIRNGMRRVANVPHYFKDRLVLDPTFKNIGGDIRHMAFQKRMSLLREPIDGQNERLISRNGELDEPFIKSDDNKLELFSDEFCYKTTQAYNNELDYQRTEFGVDAAKKFAEQRPQHLHRIATNLAVLRAVNDFKYNQMFGDAKNFHGPDELSTMSPANRAEAESFQTFEGTVADRTKAVMDALNAQTVANYINLHSDVYRKKMEGESGNNAG